MGEPSRLDRLQIRLNLMRQTVRELEEQIERERNPAARHKRPKLTVIKGGLAAWLGPFAVVGAHAKEQLAIGTAGAATVVATTFGGAAIIAETPLPATAEPVTSSTYSPSDAGTTQPGPPSGDGRVSAVTPRPDTNPPGAPVGASTPTPAPMSPVLAAAQIMPPPADIAPLVSLPDLTQLPEPSLPEPVPSPTPSPEPEPDVESLSQSEAVTHCLKILGVPPVGLPDCVAELVS